MLPFLLAACAATDTFIAATDELVSALESYDQTGWCSESIRQFHSATTVGPLLTSLALRQFLIRNT